VRDLSFERRANAEGFEGDSVLSVCWRCGTTVGPHETDGDGCASCRARRLAWSRFVRVGSYEGLLRKGLLELKFERSRGVGRELGRRLGLEIGRQLDRLGVVPEAARIVPVPMPWGRRMIRGVDHALVVARAAGAASGVRVSRMLRARAGPEQVGRSRRDRLTGLSRRFRRVHAPDPGVKVWIVVDDVRRTGATMSSACKALRAGRPGGQSGRIGVDNVWAAVVGVTPDRDLREG
jgi:predicted amidophosphoribosyltransferase